MKETVLSILVLAGSQLVAMQRSCVEAGAFQGENLGGGDEESRRPIGKFFVDCERNCVVYQSPTGKMIRIGHFSECPQASDLLQIKGSIEIPSTRFTWHHFQVRYFEFNENNEFEGIIFSFRGSSRGTHKLLVVKNICCAKFEYDPEFKITLWPYGKPDFVNKV